MYISYRQDQSGDWDGVIIITKKNLIVEESKIKKECGLIAMKVKSYQKSVMFSSCYKPPKNTKNKPLFEEISG